MSASARMIAIFLVVAGSQFAIAQDSLFGSRERLAAVASSPHTKLESMLTSSGYDVQREGGPEESPTVFIYVHHAQTVTDIPVNFILSPNGNIVWLKIDLGQLNPISLSNADLLKGLFNTKQMGRSRFTFVRMVQENEDVLHLGLPVDLRTLTPEQLKEAIEEITNDCARSANVWSPMVMHSATDSTSSN